MFRTITAPCTEYPFADLIAHACADTPLMIVVLLVQRHVAELESIGFVLP
ncbi:hypothetical protein ACFP2T_31035 [Plantactinospora solaniradicis]|uniref:Uncharacterized protein n=1 Tax=Plantactinospora solaniradicis TaxID=1723736 RepID=A0ABW1KG98_9ACTN